MLLFLILFLKSSDAGEYKCVATNDAGSSEGVAMLTVRSKITNFDYPFYNTYFFNFFIDFSTLTYFIAYT